MNIGIEVEFTGVKRSRVAEALGQLWGKGFEQQEYTTYRGTTRIRYIVKDEESNIWSIVKDMSIKPDCSNGHITLDYDEYMCELVSPVLHIEDMKRLYDALDIIRGLGGFVNETCGVHFHIDCPDDAIWVYKIFHTVAGNQEKILKEFGVPNNRLGRYCKLYSKEFIEGFTLLYSTKLLKEEKLSIEDIQLYLYERLGEGESRDNPRNPARYYLMNMDSIHKLGTLEFRWFNSTLSPVVIKSYIERLLGIIYENRF